MWYPNPEFECLPTESFSSIIIFRSLGTNPVTVIFGLYAIQASVAAMPDGPYSGVCGNKLKKVSESENFFCKEEKSI
jgi:hypothetical protein